MGEKQSFEKNYDIYDSQFGTVEITGGYKEKLKDLGFQVTGFPKEGITFIPKVCTATNDGEYKNVQDGRIYNNGNNYYFVKGTGAIGSYYFNNGAEQKFGMPTGEESSNWLGTFYTQRFELTNINYYRFSVIYTDIPLQFIHCPGELPANCQPPKVWDDLRNQCSETATPRCNDGQAWDGSRCVDTNPTEEDLNNALKNLTGIKLNPNGTNNEYIYYLDNDANMPQMDFVLRFEGVTSPNEIKALSEFTKDKFNWHVEIEYWDGTWKGQHFINTGIHRQRSGKATGDYWELNGQNLSSIWHLDANTLGNNYGGGANGKVTAALILEDKNLSTEAGFQIWGTEPSLEQKESYMPKEIKAIYKYEARDGKHFGAASNGLLDPVVSFDGGFGLTQLTECNGLPTYKEIWSWKSNIDGGQACFNSKLSYARNHLNGIIGAGNYSEDELMREAFQRYNGTYYYDNVGGRLVKSTNCQDWRGNVCTYGDNVFHYYKSLK